MRYVLVNTCDARAARIILDHLYGDPATIRVQIAVGVGTRHGYT